MFNFGAIRNLLLVLGLMIFATTASAEKLDLSEGTMTTGGKIAFLIQNSPINNIPSSSLQWALDLQLGYFIVDRLAIDLGFTSGGAFTNPISGASVGIGAGARYFFDFGSMINPYLGTMPGFTWDNFTNGPGSSLWSFVLPLKAGVLFALNSHVALDFGAQASFAWGLQSNSSTIFGGQLGYAGVQAFF